MCAITEDDGGGDGDAVAKQRIAELEQQLTVERGVRICSIVFL